MTDTFDYKRAIYERAVVVALGRVDVSVEEYIRHRRSDAEFWCRNGSIHSTEQYWIDLLKQVDAEREMLKEKAVS